MMTLADPTTSNQMTHCKLKGSAGNSITIYMRIPNIAGSFARVAQAVAVENGLLAELTLIDSNFNETQRAVTIHCTDETHAKSIIARLRTLEGIAIERWTDDTLELHRHGKLEVNSRIALNNKDSLSRAYTPGVARVCNLIAEDRSKAAEYTIKGNSVAIVTDGSAVLGLGNIGPEAALPVMEGKAILFKQFADVDAYPICLATQDTEEIIRTIKSISPGFGGINLEDISAPRCFEIESRLEAELDIPVFHDDQHGTAVVVLAGLLNALKLVQKNLSEISVVISGFGSGGVAITRLLMEAGVRQIIPCDSQGIVYEGRPHGMNPVKDQLAAVTNRKKLQGTLKDALIDADVFIGVSQPGVLNADMVASMAATPIIFALANPTPEIFPHEIEHLDAIVATGRSDYKNQINNVLCFPGLFRGALDAKTKNITTAMKIAAAHAIADCVAPEKLNKDYIIPDCFQKDVASKVARAIQEAV